ncbi:MAG: ISL3 family transposase [Gammaproteobacteria bacterium]
MTNPVSIEQLLNLPDVRVFNVEISKREIRCDLESTRGFAICHRCGERATKFFEHGETFMLRHLPICERKVTLYLHTQRYRCLYCEGQPTTTERGDWYDSRANCTKAFADSLLRDLVNSTISDVADKHQVPYGCVRGLLTRYVRGEVDWSQFKYPRQIGLDEISLLKGHKDFVTLVSTRDEHGEPAILAVLDGRKKETVKTFLESIPEALRATIEEVCTDLYDGFINAAQAVLPQARVVGDRFHVAKLYRAALDDLRKSELKEPRRVLPKDEFKGLKGVPWALRRKSEDLTAEEQQVLDLMFECSPTLRKAYALREKLTRIFDTKQTKEAAQARLLERVAEVERSGLACFDKFIRTLKERIEIITNYFVNRSNSGWIEGLNNKIKVIKRRCYGLTSAINVFRRIWLDLNGREAFAS